MKFLHLFLFLSLFFFTSTSFGSNLSSTDVSSLSALNTSEINNFVTNKKISGFFDDGLKYNGATTALDLTTNNQSVTFIYTNTANKGWIQKSNNT